MSNIIRWAVIGATGIARTRTIPGLVQAKNTKLVAVQTRPEDIEPLKQVASQYSVPYFTSVEEMLKTVECDAVYIGSPQYVHLDQIKIAASFKKPILCEKPIARTVPEAKELLSICKKAKVKFGTGFMLRFHTLHRKARQLVKEGAIGQVVSAKALFGFDYPPMAGAFRQVAELGGGGAFMDVGNHAMDTIEYITGKRLTTVMGVSQNLIHKYEPEDVCAAILEFEGGGIGLVDTYMCLPFDACRRDVEINGTKGTLWTSDTMGQTPGGKLTLRTVSGTQVFESDNRDMYLGEIEAFSNALLAGKEPPVGAEDGLHSQELVEACYKSCKTGKRVKVRKTRPIVE
jgi:1,5-anhydro-D-fructose reductase (1,5-anhydro-D-mannitol-forming)